MIEINWDDFQNSEFWWLVNVPHDHDEHLWTENGVNEQLYAQMMGWA